MAKETIEHPLQRSGGGVATLHVGEGAVTLNVPPPVTPAEKEAMEGLKQLADALKRPSEEKEGRLSIQTNGKDPALGAVVANVLAAHNVISPGEEQKLRTELDKATHAQTAPEPEPVHAFAGLAVAKEAAAAIGAAMRNMVAQESMPERVVAASTPSKDVSSPTLRGMA